MEKIEHLIFKFIKEVYYSTSVALLVLSGIEDVCVWTYISIHVFPYWCTAAYFALLPKFSILSYKLHLLMQRAE
jgi:hypothetical protein